MLYWVSLFILGEVLSKVLPIEVVGVITVGIALVIMCIPTVFFRKNRKILMIGILFLLMGSACFSYMNKKYMVFKNCNKTEISFEGVVTGIEKKEKNINYTIKTTKINNKKIKIGIIIKFQDKEYVSIGNKIQGSGKSRYFKKSRNPGGFDEYKYQMGKGNLFYIENARITKNEEPKLSINKKLYELREYFVSIYHILLKEENASLACAMVLGDKTSLDSDIKALYQRNGIAHLIAISGLHIAMIGGTLYHFIRKSIGSYPIAACFGILFIIFYGVMTGLSGSTLRAVIMLGIAIGADVTGRKYDMLNATAMALWIMLIWNPYQITQVGFLLSFGAIIGIAVVNPLWKKYIPKLPKCLDGLTVSISVQIVLIPIMLYYFYEIPVYGVFLNVLVIPLMSILLVTLIASVFVSMLFIQGGAFIIKMADVIFYIYEFFCKMSEKLPMHTICTGRPSILWVIGYYVILVIIIFTLYKEKKKFFLFGSIIYIGLFSLFFLPKELKICMFDVGQGDGIYIRSPQNQHILIDGGSTSKQKIGKYILKNGLKYHGCNKLDYVFVTHLDLDHCNGVMELLEDSTIQIEKLFLPAISNPDETYLKMERLAMNKGCKLFYLRKGDTFYIDDILFRCLNPEEKEYLDKNQGSIVLHLRYKEFDALFTGDIDEKIEKEILNDMDTTVEYLKVAHHGANTSTSELFLNQMKPVIASVSVGEYNSYGHPAKEVMCQLRKNCKKIYLTKDSGAITINTNGICYQITSFLSDE